jgi:hypothetical protein
VAWLLAQPSYSKHKLSWEAELHRSMPNGDLAAVVLEAAKKERAKEEAGQPSAFQNSNGSTSTTTTRDKGKGKARARENGDALGGHNSSNGHLEPPKETFPGYNRHITASPEPLNPAELQGNHNDQDDLHDRARPAGASTNGSVPRPASPGALEVPSRQDSTSQEDSVGPIKPAKKRPAVRAGPSARKLSSAFFGHASSGSGNSSSRVNKQAARRQYTSESSTSYDDSHHYGVSDNNEFKDFFSSAFAGHSQAASDANKTRLGGNAASNTPSGVASTHPQENMNGNAAPNNKPSQAGSSNSSGPMRGPFSRLDSSRGQQQLQRRVSLSGQEHETHLPPPARVGPQRRYSVSGAAQRFGHALGHLGHPFETEEESEGEEVPQRQDSRHSSQQLAGVRTPGAERHAFFRDSSQDDGTSQAGHLASSSGAPKDSPLARPQGVSRRSSYRSLNNIFKRSQGPAAESTAAMGAREEDGAGHPGFSRSNTQADAGGGKGRWNQLRQRLKQEKKTAEFDMTLNGKEVINDLSLGLVSVMMLKMYMDRNEHDQRRVGGAEQLQFQKVLIS